MDFLDYLEIIFSMVMNNHISTDLHEAWGDDAYRHMTLNYVIAFKTTAILEAWNARTPVSRRLGREDVWHFRGHALCFL